MRETERETRRSVTRERVFAVSSMMRHAAYLRARESEMGGAVYGPFESERDNRFYGPFESERDNLLWALRIRERQPVVSL